ncbi:MAG TPA: hypothetical protein VEY51_21690 [Chondromyces sp.]|nr:hypothetical protein [Chondromyces sp.]
MGVLDDYNNLMAYHSRIVDSIMKPWNLMYYKSQPPADLYFSNLNSENIGFKERRKGSNTYEIHTSLSFIDLAGETKNYFPDFIIMTVKSTVATLTIKSDDIFLANTLYESIKFVGDYKELKVKTVCLYNQETKLSVQSYDSESIYLEPQSNLYISFGNLDAYL